MQLSLIRSTDMGMLTISNELIAEVLFEAAALPECAGSLWLSTPKGKIVASLDDAAALERNSLLRSSLDKSGHIVLMFFVVTRFGASIRRVTKAASDYAASRLKSMTGCDVASVTILIAGVRSRHIVRRSTKVVYRYIGETPAAAEDAGKGADTGGRD